MAKIPASIEVAPKQAIESADLPGLFPAGSRVYITDIGTDPTDVLVAAAKRVASLGYKPVPHFASRRLTTKAALEDRIKRTVAEAGVSDVLVIGGGLEKPAGEFASSMEVLKTGLFEGYGIKEIGVAGHPEGSPDFSEATAIQALKEKQAWAAEKGVDVRIVTQFGFDAKKFISWAEGLRANGIELPVHLGVSGPAKITTLIKFAAMCGVGNSISFLKKNALSVTAMALGHNPEEIVGPIERHFQANPNGPVQQIHIFPFGGLKKSSEWLVERGSWGKNSTQPSAMAASR
jgi:methylenetetrahydrofolate reductase (NADPH)